MGELQRVKGVLLDEEHRQAFRLVELGDDVEDLLDDQRREAERRLVEQQQPRPAHQRARDRQHLLLAARQRAAALRRAFLEAREHREDAFEILVEMREVVDRRAHLQILEHGHAREDAPSFRRLRDRQPRDLMRRQVGDVAPVEDDRAAPCARAAEDRHHRRRLAGAVGADQRDDLAFVDVDVDALQRLNLAVEGLDAAHRQQRLADRSGAARLWHASPPGSCADLRFHRVDSSSSATPR